MSKNEFFKPANLARLAIAAAMYAALTLALPGLSYGGIQVRFSELLVLLCFYRRDYSVSLILGCFIANIFSPMALMDMLFGTLATALAVIPMFSFRNIWLASLLPVITNGVIIAVELYVAYHEPVWLSMLTVAAGELIVCTIIGCPLFKLVFEKSPRLMRIIGANKHSGARNSDKKKI